MIYDRDAREVDNEAVAERAARRSRVRFLLLPFLLVTLFLLAAVLLAKGPAIIPFIYKTL
jgi:hypothetical protein